MYNRTPYPQPRPAKTFSNVTYPGILSLRAQVEERKKKQLDLLLYQFPSTDSPYHYRVFSYINQSHNEFRNWIFVLSLDRNNSVVVRGTVVVVVHKIKKKSFIYIYTLCARREIKNDVGGIFFFFFTR